MKGVELKILTPNQRIPVALAQVKEGNTSENLLNQKLFVSSKRNY